MDGKPPSVSRKKPKPIFSLDTPYTSVQWPVVSADHQAEILDMLCSSLLSPIGEDKSRNIAPSKGKRAKKRKRKAEETFKTQSAASPHDRLPETEAPARPEIKNYLTIGFNTTTRYLEALAKNIIPGTSEDLGPAMASNLSARSCPEPANLKPLAAVFIPRFCQPPALYSHLPPLVKAASLAVPLSPPPKIISLPEGAEDRLKTILSIPRVGMVGLVDGAPSASSLIESLRQKVPDLEVPWLQEAVQGTYLAVKIKAIQPSEPPNSQDGTST